MHLPTTLSPLPPTRPCQVLLDLCQGGAPQRQRLLHLHTGSQARDSSGWGQDAPAPCAALMHSTIVCSRRRCGLTAHHGWHPTQCQPPCAHLAQPVAQQHHARRIARHRGTATHGHAHVGTGQCRRIIHTIPYHGHPPALRPQAAHKLCLLLGAHAGTGILGCNAGCRCHGLHRFWPVAAQQHDPKARPLQCCHGGRRIWPQRVAEQQAASQAPPRPAHPDLSV